MRWVECGSVLFVRIDRSINVGASLGVSGAGHRHGAKQRRRHKITYNRSTTPNQAFHVRRTLERGRGGLLDGLLSGCARVHLVVGRHRLRAASTGVCVGDCDVGPIDVSVMMGRSASSWACSMEQKGPWPCPWLLRIPSPPLALSGEGSACRRERASEKPTVGQSVITRVEERPQQSARMDGTATIDRSTAACITARIRRAWIHVCVCVCVCEFGKGRRTHNSPMHPPTNTQARS